MHCSLSKPHNVCVSRIHINFLSKNFRFVIAIFVVFQLLYKRSFYYKISIRFTFHYLNVLKSMLLFIHETNWIERRWVEMTGFTFPCGRNKLRIFIKIYEADRETQMKLHARSFGWNVISLPDETSRNENGESDFKCPSEEFACCVITEMKYSKWVVRVKWGISKKGRGTNER